MGACTGEGLSVMVGSRLMAALVGKAVEPVALEFGDDRGSTFEPARGPFASQAVGGTVDLNDNRFAESRAVGDRQSDSQSEPILRIERGVARIERPPIDSHQAEFVFEAGQ